jgi:aspartate aminotransferase
MGSFSKNLSFAGERIGFVAMSPKMPDAELLAAAVTMTVRTLGFVNAPIIGQKLAMDLLEESADRSIYDRRREMMCAVLDGAGISYFKPQGAFYFFPEAPGGDDVAFVDALLAENILAVPGSGFGMKGHFRLSFSVEDRVISGSAEGFKRAAARFRNS